MLAGAPVCTDNLLFVFVRAYVCQCAWGGAGRVLYMFVLKKYPQGKCNNDFHCIEG